MASRIIPYKSKRKQCFLHCYFREYDLYDEHFTVIIAAIFDENGCLYSRMFSPRLHITPLQAQGAVERFCRHCTCFENFSAAFKSCCIEKVCFYYI